MTENVGEKELLRRVAALPREIKPRNDPWPAIAARIGQAAVRRPGGSETRAWLWRAAAASLVVAVAAGLLLGPRWGSLPVTEPVDTVAMPAAGDLRLPASLAASEAEYQAAFREFITVGRARQGLPPKTIDRIESGWADLRDTEDALTAALVASPGNAFLTARMMELRARQLSFLKQLATLDQDYRRLTT